MAHQMIDYEEEMMKLWGLVNELSEQLANNRALVEQLKSRADNVKGQAVHVGAGFPLRRFNLDISDEEFQTELEAFASHLVLENQTLQHENKQLNTLLKEYEQTLETVMGKFRGVAHSSQQHDLALHSYYTQLLRSLQTAHSAAQLHDDTSLSLLLTRLSTLLRSALRSANGEDPPLEEGAFAGHSSPGSPRSAASSPTRPGARPPPRPQAFPGFIPGSSGGYFGTEGQSDWALEREMEIQRLEEENRALREMLGIAEEAASAPLPEEEKTSPELPERRLSTLTAEDLEADAEMEQHRSRQNPPAAPQEAQGVDAGVLGFRAEAASPPPEQVFDETDGEAV
ncbi:hypothetical protein CC85DRAFT_287600 [Cutaneotrichosporon oleaginosum]|uniref:Uncharacterized protein n=1 Tax=Cutaneotrichosporon oleaginosum TaxID=879819 RepID=A0A0J1AY81_9TREE|nr:uncharacterized protein CC85DRAFT_287600 [Cutaneotrichosporon oleaginosum]KLT40284.1 hypothetical protein CC85DRAFT_287600 [Cutaneotrichosporon oleaginosum]TXT08003.1 hypothetical protein COLE_04927 [Cutaneotrichosporon oleaginosum]